MGVSDEPFECYKGDTSASVNAALVQESARLGAKTLNPRAGGGNIRR